MGIDAMRLKMMYLPKSSWKNSAIAKGPGVGGTKEWVTKRAAPSEQEMVTTLFPVFRESDLESGERMTNAESQKTGIETMKPVMAIAISSLPLPSILMKVSAIFFAAPLTSKMAPIMTPKPMMIPMLPKVEPKPSLMAPSTLAGERPAIRPAATEPTIIAKKT